MESQGRGGARHAATIFTQDKLRWTPHAIRDLVVKFSRRACHRISLLPEIAMVVLLVELRAGMDPNLTKPTIFLWPTLVRATEQTLRSCLDAQLHVELHTD